LGVYGEDLANGARAAVFGSAALGLAEELVSRGARLVHVYDPDVARLAEATARRRDRSTFYGPLPESGDVGVRDGAFDFVIVPDLSFVEDTRGLLALVRRVLSPAGAALIASPNGEATAPLIPVPLSRSALGYYELYEAVAEHFTSVRMLGQAPFVGYAVAEFSVEDPEPTIDTSLAESDGKEPDWFVVLASERNVRLDPFALIELPKNANIEAPSERPLNPSRESPESVGMPSSERSGTVLVDILEAEREAALESLRQKESLVKEERHRAEVVTQQLAACREELSLLRERCRAAEQRRDDDEQRRLALEVELEGARNNPEISRLRARVQSQESSSRDLVEEHERDIARLETQLRDRGKEVQELRSEVDRRETLVRELLATNLSAPAEPAAAEGSSNGHEGVIADLSARLDRLASDAAKREADLQAAQWKIALLERQLSGQR
jgi:hypothetical protein